MRILNAEERQLLEEGYTLDQITEIQAGKQKELDVSIYADKKYVAIQMRQIRYGLEDRLDVSVYANPDYDWFQMEEIRKGLLDHLDIEKYASPEIPYDKMKQIRLGLGEDIDLTPFKHLEAGVLRELRLSHKKNIKIISYINAGYNTDQLSSIREALEKNLPIDQYLNKVFRGAAIREISLGLEHGVDVSVYVNPRYSWRQMREIRFGLERRIDVSQYASRYYNFEQMQEIRLGLEVGLDVSYFKSLRYTASDMKERRLALLEHPGLAVEDQSDHESDTAEDAIHIVLENENTEAYVDVRGVPTDTLRIEMLKALRKRDISVGVRYDVIDQLIEGKGKKSRTLIAAGSMPQDGADGHYEYFFRTELSHAPKQTEDGNVDFRSVEWFEQVEKGQKLAVYHSAQEGKSGVTVFGKEIPARKGKEQCILTGKGFHRLDDGITYVADMDGLITFSEKRDNLNVATEIRLDIIQLLEVDEVSLTTGDIHYNGNVSVRGNIHSGAAVYATGDVFVGGFVESAKIFSGGNVVIRQGVNASGNGLIHAVGDVAGLFFEAVKIESEGNIRADYYMNCEMSARDKIYAEGKKGSIAGGTAHAGEGMQVKRLGNPAGLATFIKLGDSDRITEEIQKLVDRIRDVAGELAILTKAHQDFVSKYPPQIRGSNEMFIKIGNAIYTKELEMKELELKKHDLEERRRKDAFAGAEITLRLYENVDFEIGGVRWKNTAVCKSAVRVQKKENKIAVFSKNY